MLARQQSDGEMEIRRGGRILARVVVGDVYCYNCDLIIAVKRAVDDTGNGSCGKMVYNASVSARSEE